MKTSTTVLAVLLLFASVTFAQPPAGNQPRPMPVDGLTELFRTQSDRQLTNEKPVESGLKLSLILDKQSVTVPADIEQRMAEYEAAAKAERTWQENWEELAWAVVAERREVPVGNGHTWNYGRYVSREEAIKQLGPAPLKVSRPPRPLSPGITLRIENISDEVRRIYRNDRFELKYSGPGKKQLKNFTRLRWLNGSIYQNYSINARLFQEPFVDILPGDSYEIRLNQPQQKLPFYLVKSCRMKVELAFYSDGSIEGDGKKQFDAAVFTAKPAEFRVELR